VLAEVTGCSIATVGRAIRVLKDDNWIDTVKIGNASAYCVNERAFWQAGRNQRQYAVFSATVIAAASEQDSDFREKAKQKLTYIPVIEDSDIAVTGNDQLPPPDQQDLDI
jgi:DNA-binding transcriptional regulator GbsR (MarR family)